MHEYAFLTRFCINARNEFTALCGGDPKISVTPQNLSFVALLNSSTEPQKVTIKNVGESDLIIQFAQFQEGGNTAIGSTIALISSGSSTLKPGDESFIEAKGTCGSTVGKLEGTITISSNDPSSPTTVNVTLECTGPEPAIFVTPPALPLVAELDKSESSTLMISNIGDAPLEIERVSFSGNSLNGANVSIGTISNATIPAKTYNGPTISVTGTCGSSEGRLEGAITIQSNDRLNPKVISVSLECVKPDQILIKTFLVATFEGSVYCGNDFNGWRNFSMHLNYLKDLRSTNSVSLYLNTTDTLKEDLECTPLLNIFWRGLELQTNRRRWVVQKVPALLSESEARSAPELRVRLGNVRVRESDSAVLATVYRKN
jgi:hypothetical protein